MSYLWLRGQESDWAAPIRLICFHHAGGGASSFNGWRKQLPDDIGLLRVQLPGREDHTEKEVYTTTEDLIPVLLEQLSTILDDPRPFILYGHSLGAIVTFELVRYLRRHNLSMPEGVFISGRRAPHLPLSHPALCHLPDDELVYYLTIMGGTVGNILQQEKWRQYIFPTLRADLAVSDLYSYYPDPPIDCPLGVFGGTDDQTVKLHEWQAWQQHFTNTITVQALPGKHFFAKEGQEKLIQDIARFCLDSLPSENIQSA